MDIRYGWAIVATGLCVSLLLPSRAGAAFFVEFGSTGEVTSGQSTSTLSSTTVTSRGGFVGVEDGAPALATRVGFNVNADADVVAIEAGILSFQVGFAVAHFQAFDVTVAVEMNGEMRRIADDPDCQGAVIMPDILMPNLRRRSDDALFPLDIVLPGGALEFGAGDAQLTLSAERVSTVEFRNQTVGSDAYFIDFLVSATAISQSCEVSARFGADNGRTANCSACTYPGAGDRVRNDDGIVVAVIITNLCGNGTVDAGEACDLGALNGERNACCGDDCRVVAAGNVCRPAVDDCDLFERCDGASASCPEDQKKSPGSFCTDDQNDCTDDVCTESAVCVHVPLEGAFCDDEFFCNGENHCSARGQCEDVTPAPCPQDRCDEATDSCLLATATPTPPPGSTPTPTRSATPTGSPGACAGDCNTDRMVAINELILGVNIALGSQPVSACVAFDTNDDDAVAINELVAGVSNALDGCAD